MPACFWPRFNIRSLLHSQLVCHCGSQSQAQIDNARENHSRIAYYYAVGDLVLIQLNKRTLPKLACPTEGPYRIIKVHMNGTVIIQRGTYAETINIHRLLPFLSPSSTPLDVGGLCHRYLYKNLRINILYPICLKIRSKCDRTSF
jgi:hypothetical protein